jgi:Pycsar effector protein
MTSDQLWRVLDTIQLQIRGYDTKAQIVIGFTGVLAGFLGTQAGNMTIAAVATWPQTKSFLLFTFGGTCLVFLAASLAYATCTIYPRLRLNQPPSLLFFDHIEKTSSSSYIKGREMLTKQTAEELDDDICNQIIANSIVCCKKAARFHVAITTTALAMICWFVTIALYASIQSYLASHSIKP